MRKKLIMAIVYVGVGYLVYLYGEAILDWFQKPNQVVWVALVATFMALFPVIPYPIVGGVIGMAYGPILGGFVTWIGSASASIIMFLFVRYGYQDWGLKILHKHQSVAKITSLFERNAFLAILFARMIPVIPSIIVNVYSALSRVSFAAYAVASSLGKVPAMLLFALVGDNLITEPRNIFITIGVYGIFLGITLWLYRMWRRNQGVYKKAGDVG